MPSNPLLDLDATAIRKMIKAFFAKATVKIYRPGNGYTFIPGGAPETTRLFLEELFQDDNVLDNVEGAK